MQPICPRHRSGFIGWAAVPLRSWTGRAHYCFAPRPSPDRASGGGRFREESSTDINKIVSSSTESSAVRAAREQKEDGRTGADGWRKRPGRGLIDLSLLPARSSVSLSRPPPSLAQQRLSPRCPLAVPGREREVHARGEERNGAWRQGSDLIWGAGRRSQEPWHRGGRERFQSGYQECSRLKKANGNKIKKVSDSQVVSGGGWQYSTGESGNNT